LPPIRLTRHIEELKKEDFTAATGRRPFPIWASAWHPSGARLLRKQPSACWLRWLFDELRQARELSQEELARELKVGQPAVTKLGTPNRHVCQQFAPLYRSPG